MSMSWTHRLRSVRARWWCRRGLNSSPPPLSGSDSPPYSGSDSTLHSGIDSPPHSGIDSPPHSGIDSPPHSGSASPLRSLLEAASAHGEAAPLEPALQWATQPYAAPGPAADRADSADRDPRHASVLLFPGQGAHWVGMGLALKDVPAARQLYDTASEVLGWDVWRTCTSGPASRLERHAQVCTLVTSLAALERARDERPGAVQRVRAAAGFSLGELAALVFGGALPLGAAVRLAAVREEAARDAAARRPQGMTTVWLAPAAPLADVARGAREAARAAGVQEPVCDVAVYLQPGCRALAGDDAALRWLEAGGARALGVRRAARLAVPAAFHCALLEPTREAVDRALTLCPPLAPRLPVWSCTSARPYRSARDVRRGVSALAVRAVRWEQTLQALLARPNHVAPPLVLALGPGRALRSALRHVNARAWDASLQVDV